MKIFKQAFTLAEVIVAMSTLIIITAMIIPTIKRAMPNTDAIKFKQVYLGTLTTINSMINDARVYPDARGFADTSEGQDALGIKYSGATKFSDLFISKLNVIDKNVNTGNSRFIYAIDEIGGTKTANAFTCVKVNTGAIFCLPPDVSALNPRKPNSTNAVYIRVYLQDEDFSEKKAFFIAVRANGRVYLPSKGIGFDCTEIQNGRMRDHAYNQCQANEMLSSSTMPESN